MAMMMKKSVNDEIPEGAKMLNEDQAIRYQLGIIRNWEKFSDVFYLRAGTGILGGFAAISALAINNHFRYKLKLGTYGRMSSYLSVVCIPAVITMLFQTTFIQSKVILRLYDCPLCLQTRSAIFQAGSGVAYPFILSPLAAFMFATRHFTYKLPSVTEQPKEILKLFTKFTKSAGTMAGFLLGVNMLAAMWITSGQMKEHAFINMQLEEFEKKIESGSITTSEFKKYERLNKE